MCAFKFLIAILIALNIALIAVSGQEFLMKAAKQVPRIGRSNQKTSSSLDEMGKFFMKASKSVPRIGRRNEESNKGSRNEFGFALEQTGNNGESPDKRAPHYMMPAWNEIADKFEYQPDLFAYPELVPNLEDVGMMGDDPSAYDWERVRVKRAPNHKSKQFM